MSASRLSSWQNTFKSAMDPSKARVMIGKVITRFTDDKGSIGHAENVAWLKVYATDLNQILNTIDSAIAQEARDFMEYMAAHSAKVLSEIPYDLGGGGGVPLLYALTRLRKPQNVVETGVASGFSSATILAALDKNGSGHLYSSDFPYFRIPNPERFVGVVVEEKFKSRWSLFLKGDGNNLRTIVGKMSGPIDIFHYDSDKSYKGRTSAMAAIQSKITSETIIIMDDIQDNAYFHDLVAVDPAVVWAVYAYEGKYIGVIGKAF